MTDNLTPTGAEMSLGAQRAATCPITPCRGADDHETLLRSARSDRLLCLYCATRIPTGYIGREEARAVEDKFYKATQTDYAIQFAVCAGGGAVAAVLSLLFGIFLFAFFIGAAVGGAVATLARRLTGGRLGRYSPQIALGGVALGTIIAPIAYVFIVTGRIVPQAAFSLNTIVCGVIVGIAVYAIMKGRI
jgi:MFS family permease